MSVSRQTIDSMKALGQRLRDARLQRNDSQQVFAARIGVSVPTLSKMEKGEPSVQIGSWATALDILGRTSDLEHILAPADDLFAKYERSQTPKRQRASRKDTR